MAPDLYRCSACCSAASPAKVEAHQEVPWMDMSFVGPAAQGACCAVEQRTSHSTEISANSRALMAENNRKKHADPGSRNVKTFLPGVQ